MLVTRTAAGRFLSAPVLALAAGMAAAATGILPVTSPAYDVVSSCLMPLAAALCLLEADLTECALLLHALPDSQSQTISAIPATGAPLASRFLTYFEVQFVEYGWYHVCGFPPGCNWNGAGNAGQLAARGALHGFY